MCGLSGKQQNCRRILQTFSKWYM